MCCESAGGGEAVRDALFAIPEPKGLDSRASCRRRGCEPSAGLPATLRDVHRIGPCTWRRSRRPADGTIWGWGRAQDSTG